MADKGNGTEHELEEDVKDEFDEVFGLDEEKKKARGKIKKLVEEEREKMEKETAPVVEEEEPEGPPTEPEKPGLDEPES